MLSIGNAARAELLVNLAHRWNATTFPRLLPLDLGLRAQGSGLMVWGLGLVLKIIDSCITQLKAQGPSRTCNESKEEEDAACAV